MLPSAYPAPQCPGFCARYPIQNSTQQWTECGPCAWGSRSMSSQCISCESSLSLYDWMYLIFMFLLPLFIHTFCIHYFNNKKCSLVHEVCELLCSIVECLIAAFSAILLFPPYISFQLWGCGKSSIKEWYPALFNPVIHHIKSMRCSYEVVFPLYSLPFVYFLCLFFSILLFRSILYCFVLKKKRDGKAYYYALLTLPKLAILHAVLAGVIYHLYPYIVILCSVCSNAIHLAMEGKATCTIMIKRLFTSPIHITLLTINMGLLAFAIIALSGTSSLSHSLFSLLLVPIPPIFYILTISCSHPSVLMDT